MNELDIERINHDLKLATGSVSAFRLAVDQVAKLYVDLAEAFGRAFASDEAILALKRHHKAKRHGRRFKGAK